MKFAMVICNETDQDAVVAAVEHAGGIRYTLLSRVHGSGKSGKRGETEANLGSNSMLLVAFDDLVAEQVKEALAAMDVRLQKGRHPSGLHAFCWEAQEWL